MSDYSVELPAGAVPVLINSHEWYKATAAARYLCQNIDYDRWFRRRSHQRYLQTFHGYPFKSMGVALWKAQGRSDWVVDGEVDRRTQAWTSILLPDESTVQMYREAYRYDGDVLVTGYPRDDSILAPDRDEVRDRTRAKLGLGDGQKAVLYAPTWRDTAATGAWTAEMFDELDLDRIINELGGDFTVLLRGHNYVFRARQSRSVADVVDVTSYPEINDLILAADVAVLDYSSLRFDWMLSGKPAVFFVPDLDDYLSARTALFDYRPTAPGPLLRTTDEVIAALRDLDGITDRYAEDRATLNATFQPLNDGHAAARVVDAFFGPDAGPNPASSPES